MNAFIFKILIHNKGDICMYYLPVVTLRHTLIQMFLGYSCALRFLPFFITRRRRDKCNEEMFVEYILILIRSHVVVEHILMFF